MKSQGRALLGQLFITVTKTPDNNNLGTKGSFELVVAEVQSLVAKSIALGLM